MNVNRTVSSSSLQRLKENPVVASMHPRVEAPLEHEGLQKLYKPAVIRLDPADAERLDDVMRKLKEWNAKHPDVTGAARVIVRIELSRPEHGPGFEYTYGDAGECDLKEAGLETSDLIGLTRSVLEPSGQLAYLLQHRDHLVSKRYCVQLALYFQGALDVSKSVGFHMDEAEKGVILFNNIYYDTDVTIDGAEFIVNPETLGGRLKKLRGEVPDLVMQHLQDVHARTYGEVIHESQVQRGDMLSFTNLAIYHKTPDPKSRGVDLAKLQAGLSDWCRKVGEYGWAQSYQRCAELVAVEDSSVGLGPDDLKFMAEVDKPVLSFARCINAANRVGQEKVYMADLVQAGVKPVDALALLEYLGAKPTEVLNVQRGMVHREYPLTHQPRTLKRELSDTMRKRPNDASQFQPPTRCFMGVMENCLPRG